MKMLNARNGSRVVVNRSASDVPQSNLETGVRFEWIEPGIAALRFRHAGKSANVMTATMLN
jgi:hypothetical protein